MKILIYGGGAVGLGIASCLLRFGDWVDIVAREKTISTLKHDGLVRTGIFGDYSASPNEFGSYSSLEDLPEESYDYVLVCTKSHDSSKAAKDLSNHTILLGNVGKIVLFQNGWGNAEIFAARFPKERIYSARVITGFQRPKPNVVEVTVHADSIHIGSLFENDLTFMGPLSRSIDLGGIPCQVVPDGRTRSLGQDALQLRAKSTWCNL